MDYVNIFDYTDYRLFLKEYHTLRKESDSRFSHRFFAQKAGYSSTGYYSNVVKGVLNLTKKYIPKFIHALGLEGKEADYFKLMIQYSHEMIPAERQIVYEQMIALMPPKAQRMKLSQKSFYQCWYTSAVLIALDILDFEDDYKELSDFINPPIKVIEAKKCVALLKELGLIVQDGNGFWKQTNAKIVGGEEVGVHTIHQYQSQFMEMASEAQARYAPKDRFISTKTISTSKRGLERIKQSVRELYVNIDSIVLAESEASQVYQCNIQFFPITKDKHDESYS